jgi:hypothetical protein
MCSAPPLRLSAVAAEELVVAAQCSDDVIATAGIESEGFDVDYPGSVGQRQFDRRIGQDEINDGSLASPIDERGVCTCATVNVGAAIAEI